MMEHRSRRKFSPEFTAKVVLESLRERGTLEEIAQQFELHPTQITQWKQEATSRLSELFERASEPTKRDMEEQSEKVYAQIGQRKVENDFLKKSCGTATARAPHHDRPDPCAPEHPAAVRVTWDSSQGVVLRPLR